MNAREWGRWWRLVGKTGLLDVLAREWDPIGLGALQPADEYECVAGPIATLLRRSAPIDQLADTLTEHRTGHLGVDADLTADQRTADELVAWYDREMRNALPGDINER
jgi:hypothetical protein